MNFKHTERDNREEYRRQVCRYWERNSCRFGENCRFEHPIFCRYRENCRSPTNCSFYHAREEQNWCRFQERCNRREKCQFLHRQNSQKTPCKFFNEDRCSRPDCRFTHFLANRRYHQDVRLASLSRPAVNLPQMRPAGRMNQQIHEEAVPMWGQW